MKIKLSLIALIGLLSGCASMHTTVLEQVHIGDNQDKLVELFGQPDSFGPSNVIPGADAWYYTKRADICGFTIQDKIIKKMACIANPNYVSTRQAIGRSLSAAGEGYRNAAATAPTYQAPISCMSNSYGGMTQTTCR